MKIKKNIKKGHIKLARKQSRKEKRQQKKLRKNDYFNNRNKSLETDENKPETIPEKSSKKPEITPETIRKKEKKLEEKLHKQMAKQRTKQMIQANNVEDRNIKRLEKQLKLHKRKSKSIPKSFQMDGLDFLLEVCDADTRKTTVTAEQLNETDVDFKEDFDLVLEENAQSDAEMDAKSDSLDFSDAENSPSEIGSEPEEMEETENDEQIWEDIYGRLRAKDGEIVPNQEKYVPPAIRAKLENTTDEKHLEKLKRINRQLKGLFNRLAESNMHKIANEIEEMYMNNSRNDMNETLTNLMNEALITPITTPERLLMEHILLITILHANIGTEIGAHFLQMMVKKFDELLEINEIENKMLDNTVKILAQMYNFKLFDSKLLYEILNELSDNFNEKHIECILHILKNVGFNLRKDNPLELKNLIINLQKKAGNIDEKIKEEARIKFLLDILMAIKNNNVTKIPNYDTTYSEHLKKIMKSFIRPGNYVTQLNISLQDLRKADERGKWWIVGSAWQGNLGEPQKLEENKSDKFSTKLLELAKKQRMNTDSRRTIFCVIMSAEDYLDAFEKLLKLNIKNQQEIIHVILHCCLQEKRYNPYYSYLTQKFCDYDRKYQMILKYTIWDKLKIIQDYSALQIAHLSKFLGHLFIEKGLSLSVLKVIEFGDLDKITLRLLRQILIILLTHDDLEVIEEIFTKITLNERLTKYRESLRLFIHYFLLRNLKNQQVMPESKNVLLETRAKHVEKILSKTIRKQY